jgi:hypothetical protein
LHLFEFGFGLLVGLSEFEVQNDPVRDVLIPENRFGTNEFGNAFGSGSTRPSSFETLADFGGIRALGGTGPTFFGKNGASGERRRHEHG